MKRRNFLTGAAAAGVAGAAASTLSAPAIAQGKRELKMVTTWPKNFPGLGTSAERLALRISEMTDGQLTVKVFAAGELVPAFEAFDAVSSGTADMYHGAEYYWQGKNPALNFFTTVPFGFIPSEINAWIYFGGGQELWDELSAGFNLKPFLVGNTGVQMGGWFNKEIKSLEDFKGLKIRMPGLGGEVCRRIGASVVNLPGGEIFAALQSGAIDATEWVGPWNDLAFGLYKVAKFYYYPGWHEPGAAISSAMNKGVWESLSKPQQTIVSSVMAAENALVLAEFDARNEGSLEVLINKHGAQLREFPNDVLEAIGTASGQVVREAGESSPLAKKIYDSFIGFRREAIAWGEIAEQAYLNARLLPFKY